MYQHIDASLRWISNVLIQWSLLYKTELVVTNQLISYKILIKKNQLIFFYIFKGDIPGLIN